MESPTGLVPERLMSAGMKGPLLDYLLAQAWPGDFKTQVLSGWAIVTGASVYQYDYAIVSASGWDQQVRKAVLP